jgi:hypothetical protein
VEISQILRSTLQQNPLSTCLLRMMIEERPEHLPFNRTGGLHDPPDWA